MSEVSTSKPMRAKASTKAKGAASTVSIARPASTAPSIGKSDIRAAAIKAWAMLDQVIQTELNSVKEGLKELNASTVTAIVKYIEASVDISRSNEDLTPKDTADKLERLYSLSELPTFDDEGDNNNSKGG